MQTETLTLLKNAAVMERVSPATRAALEDRVAPAPYTRFLDADTYALLRSLVATVLPQDAVGTHVDIAEAIDRRLAAGKNAGWRFANLPSDGEAYRQGLAALRRTLAATPMQSFDEMPTAAREAYLRCVADGEVDDAARFPLSTMLGMLRGDIVRVWMSHPETMSALQLYSFATGATGRTDGPTATEGWRELTPDTAQPFEHGTVSLEREA